MNERIEKLAEQAGMHRDKFGMYFAGGDSHNEDGVDLEKFAELIIKECARVVDIWSDEVPCSKDTTNSRLAS